MVAAAQVAGGKLGAGVPKQERSGRLAGESEERERAQELQRSRYM
jgi:hypothetical protein